MPQTFQDQLFNIKGVEIFAAGEWNGDKYTTKDLEEIEKNFQKTKEKLKPYLKLGHDDSQKLIQKDGLPSVGFIDNVVRVGNKLIADFSNIPRKIYELLSKKAYSRVSSEIYINLKDSGKTIGKALKAVALLGGDTPAVTNLDDVLSLYSLDRDSASTLTDFFASTGGAKAIEGETKCVTFDAEIKTKTEEKQMDNVEQIKAELATLEKKYAEAQKALEEYKKDELDSVEKLKKKLQEMEDENKGLKEKLSKMETKKNELDQQVQEYKTKSLEAEINSKLDDMIKNKKLLPSQRELAFALISEAKQVQEKKFKVSENELSMEEIVYKLFENSSVNVNTEEQSQTGTKQYKNSDEEIDKAAKKYAADHKISYSEALIAVYPDSVPNTSEEDSEDKE